MAEKNSWQKWSISNPWEHFLVPEHLMQGLGGQRTSPDYDPLFSSAKPCIWNDEFEKWDLVCEGMELLIDCLSAFDFI